MIRAVLYIFLFSFLGSNAWAQHEYLVAHYTADDELPSNHVYQFYQDSKGFLWFGTDKGVVRYNGIRFENFTISDGLPDNEVFAFAEDPYGRIWQYTYTGKLCYYENGVFHSDANTPFLKLPRPPRSPIRSISFSADSSVVVSYFRGMQFVVVKNGRSKVFDLEKIPNAEKKIWELRYVEKIAENRYLVKSQFSELIVDSNINVLQFTATSKYGLVKFYPAQQHMFTIGYDKKLEPVTLDGQPLAYSAKDRIHKDNDRIIGGYCSDNQIYFIGNKGVYLYDSVLLFEGKISSFTIDASGYYWVSTVNDGIYVYDRNFRRSEVSRNAYTGTVTFARPLKDGVYFLANKKLFCYKNGITKEVVDYDRILPPDLLPKASSAVLIKDSTLYFFYDKYGVALKGLYSNKPAVTVSSLVSLIQIGNYKSAVLMGQRLYLQYGFGFFYFDQYEMTKSRIPLRELNGKPDRIYAQAEDANGAIWYATADQLYKIQGDEATPQKQFGNTAFKNFTFFGRYIIGYTQSNQLLICRDYEKKVVFDTVADQNCIWDKFYQLDSTHLLITTNKAYRMLTIGSSGRAQKNTITTVDNPMLPRNVEALCIDSSYCYFFKSGTITKVGINSFFSVSTPPRVYFAYLSTGKDKYPAVERPEIRYADARNLTISFSVLSLSGKDVSYQYSLSKNGRDDNGWREFAGEKIEFFRLGYGNYTLRVRAGSPSGGYGAPAVTTFSIARPFWAQWWFYTLAAGIVALALALVIRWWVKRVVRKRENAHQVEMKFMKAEYKALNALMNPHFIFNTLNNLQSLYIENKKESANEYMRIFANLIRQNMQNVSKEQISLRKEIDLVSNYLLLEKLRFEEKLNYRIEIDHDLDLSEIRVPPLLVQPLVENSIKHGLRHMDADNGFIIVHITQRAGLLYIEVKDNGVGIRESLSGTEAEHESLGLESIKKRIDHLSAIQNKKLTFSLKEIEEDGQRWTVATITMPL